MNDQTQISKSVNERIDELELKMQEYPPVHCELTHRRVPGMYIRKIKMPAGTLITSMIHLTEHPFSVLMGKVKVISENDGEQILEAGYDGITRPNTRRILHILEDCVWITYHCCADDETVSDIEARIILRHENPLLGGVIKNNVLTKTITE